MLPGAKPPHNSLPVSSCPPNRPYCPSRRDLTNNGLGAGATAAALTFAVPAARMLATDRGRRRLGSRLQVGLGFCHAISQSLSCMTKFDAGPLTAGAAGWALISGWGIFDPNS